MTLRLATEPVARQEGGTPAALEVRGLTAAYDREPAVFSIDMTAAAGRMMAIIGPNGAGKSTLLKACLGIVPKVSGRVRVFGTSLERRRDRVAYVPQRASVDWDFPARAIDVALMGMTAELGPFDRIRDSHRARAKSCLERVGMGELADRQIGRLSGGQRQRVFLARALAQDADLYLLDEPFAGVDAATERAIVQVLMSLRDEGRTVIVVHHDLATVEEYFDDAFLIATRKVAEGPVSEAFTPENLQIAYGGRLPANKPARAAG